MELGRRRAARRHPRAGDDLRVQRPEPRRLPTRRSVLGAVLVTVAAAGVLSAHRAAAAPPQKRYVVATHAVPAGHVLREADLGTIAVDLPEDVSAVLAEDARALLGRTTRGPLGELSLVAPTDVHEVGRFASPAVVEVAVELTPARALHGTIAAGDVVDVLATDPDDSGTRVVARGARVAAVGDDDAGGIGASGATVVRLGLVDGEVAAAVVDASIRSEVSLVLPAPHREAGK